MNGIYRVLKMTLHYRFTLAGVVLSSLLMSVLWSANITVVYPFVEVVFLRKTMQEWVGDENARLKKEIDELEQQIAVVRNKLPTAEPQELAKLADQMHLLNSKVELAQRGLAWMTRIQPWI